MKKFSLFAVASLLLLAGCSESDDNLATDQSNTIEFRSVVNKSRASLVEQTTDLESFFVVGLQGAAQDDFLSASVYKDAVGWTYSPKKYWPTNDKTVNFYAFAPYSSIIKDGLTVNGVSAEFDYEVPNDQSKMNKAVDLLVAFASGKGSDNADVVFKFSHALSAVTFSAKNANPTSSELVYAIDKIEIINLDNTGTYNYSVIGGGWTPDANYDVTYTAGVPKSGVAIQPDPDNFVNLLSANDVMMVLPQEPDATARVKITYSLKDGEGAYIWPIGSTIELPFPTLLTPFAFEAGVRYNFTFVFGVSNAIVFDVEKVEDWGNYQGVPI